MAIREATRMYRLLPICFTCGKRKTFSTIKKVSKCYEHDCSSRWIFKWKHSKHSKYQNILVEILLGEQIKAEKHFLKSPQKETLCKRFSKHCLDFPENRSKFVTSKFTENWKCLFQRFRTFVSDPKLAST